MLDFRRNVRVPNYNAGPLRRRLLALVFGVGLLSLLFIKARDPRYWQWIAGLDEFAGQKEGAATQRAGIANLTPIDTVLPRVHKEERLPGTFTSPPPLDPVPPTDGRYFPGVRPDFLADVRDDDVFRSREHDAFFHLLALAAKADDKKLAAASLGLITFAQLFQQSATYRGQVVTVRGAVRRVDVPAIPTNKYGIARYHQVWIQPDDNPALPIVAYVLDLPPGFPVGESLGEEVTLTGFYYKRWAYPARDTIRRAPLVLARTLSWRNAPTAAARATNTGTIVSLVVGGCLVALLAAILVFTRVRGIPARERFVAAAAAAGGPALDRLRDAELAPTPDETLRSLSREAQFDGPLAEGATAERAPPT